MAIVKVVTESDIGAGLEILAGKLQAAIDNESIVIEGGKLKAVAKVDLRVTGINADNTNLTITVSDGNGGNETTVQTTLASLISLSQAEGNLATKKDDGIYVGKADVVAAAKEAATVELQDLAGRTLGYAFESR